VSAIVATARVAGAQAADPSPPSPASPANPARSDTSPPSPRAQADAQKAMERGLEAKQKGDLEEALLQYRRAAALVPEANLPHRYAGDALVELGRFREAIESYETYLRIKPGVQDGPALRQRIDELRARHLEGTLDIECTPEGAQVLIDGDPTPVGVTPVRALRLPPGLHKIGVRADGHREGTFSSQVVAGSSRTLQCALERSSPGATILADSRLDVAPPAPPSKGPGVFATWWFWTGVGVVLAGAGVTAIALSSSGGSDAPRTDGGTLRFR
jgi:tetratricopeptide (TPR) repeat protein